MSNLSLKNQYEEKALATLNRKELELINTKYELKIRDIINSTDTFHEKALWDEDKPEYVRELNSTEYAQYKIGTMLENGYSLVGIPYDNYPPSDIAFVLAHNVISNYGHFSLQDIVRSFNATCTGLTHVSFHPFNNQPIGWLYINNVLSQYAVYKNQNIQKIERKLISVDVRTFDQVRHDIIQGRIKDDSAIKHGWINLYNWTMKNVAYPQFYIQEAHYYYLRDLGLIEEIEEWKEDLMIIAHARIKKERAGIKNLTSIISKEIGTSDIERMYKKICVEKWLIEIRENEKSIEWLKDKLGVICCISPNTTRKLIENQKQQESSERNTSGV